jgi:pimeloyl-ACP methyl ester carboxylesterase
MLGGSRANGGHRPAASDMNPVTKPPASLLLIHGAGSGPWIFQSWAAHFSRLTVEAIDLHGGLEAERASMEDYAQAVIASARRLPQPVALCGWSMGGLVALQAGLTLQPHSLILLEPSPPGEIQGFDPDVELTMGTFEPERAYGPFPVGYPARPESLLARAERKRGIAVPSVSCPTLVVYGRDFADVRGRRVVSLYGAEERCFPDLDHWGLVLDSRVPEAIAEYLGCSGAIP